MAGRSANTRLASPQLTLLPLVLIFGLLAEANNTEAPANEEKLAKFIVQNAVAVEETPTHIIRSITVNRTDLQSLENSITLFHNVTMYRKEDIGDDHHVNHFVNKDFHGPMATPANQESIHDDQKLNGNKSELYKTVKAGSDSKGGAVAGNPGNDDIKQPEYTNHLGARSYTKSAKKGKNPFSNNEKSAPQRPKLVSKGTKVKPKLELGRIARKGDAHAKTKKADNSVSNGRAQGQPRKKNDKVRTTFVTPQPKAISEPHNAGRNALKVSHAVAVPLYSKMSLPTGKPGNLGAQNQVIGVQIGHTHPSKGTGVSKGMRLVLDFCCGMSQHKHNCTLQSPKPTVSIRGIVAPKGEEAISLRKSTMNAPRLLTSELPSREQVATKPAMVGRGVPRPSTYGFHYAGQVTTKPAMNGRAIPKLFTSEPPNGGRGTAELAVKGRGVPRPLTSVLHSIEQVTAKHHAESHSSAVHEGMQGRRTVHPSLMTTRTKFSHRNATEAASILPIDGIKFSAGKITFNALHPVQTSNFTVQPHYWLTKVVPGDATRGYEAGPRHSFNTGLLGLNKGSGPKKFVNETLHHFTTKHLLLPKGTDDPRNNQANIDTGHNTMNVSGRQAKRGDHISERKSTALRANGASLFSSTSAPPLHFKMENTRATTSKAETQDQKENVKRGRFAGPVPLASGGQDRPRTEVPSADGAGSNKETRNVTASAAGTRNQAGVYIESATLPHPSTHISRILRKAHQHGPQLHHPYWLFGFRIPGRRKPLHVVVAGQKNKEVEQLASIMKKHKWRLGSREFYKKIQQLKI